MWTRHNSNEFGSSQQDARQSVTPQYAAGADCQSVSHSEPFLACQLITAVYQSVCLFCVITLTGV